MTISRIKTRFVPLFIAVRWRKFLPDSIVKLGKQKKLPGASMNDDTTYTRFDDMEITDNSLMHTYTQVVTCVVGKNAIERRRQSLRAKLEREKYEREKGLESSFIATVRNLFKSG